MARKKDLSQAEFEVMDALWTQGEATVKEVLEALTKEPRPAYTTVATLLTRLKEKEYVEAQERNFAYVFRPLVQRDQVVRRKLDDLVHRVLGGAVAPLATYIAENRNLTPEQIETLEEIIRAESEKEGK